IPLEGPAVALAAGEDLLHAVEPLREERAEGAGEGGVREGHPLLREDGPVLPPRHGQVDPRAGIAVVVEVDEAIGGHGADRLGGAVQAAGGKLHVSLRARGWTTRRATRLSLARGRYT